MTRPRIGRPAAEVAVCPRCGLGMGALLTFEEAGRCLNVPKDTVRAWAYREKRLPVTKVVGRARVTHSDLDGLIVRPRPVKALRSA